MDIHYSNRVTPFLFFPSFHRQRPQQRRRRSTEPLLLLHLLKSFSFLFFFNSYVRSCLLLSFVITGSRKGDSLIIQISDKTWQNESFCFREYFLFSLISFLGRWLGLNHVEPRGEWWRWVSNECFYFFCGIWCFFLFLFVLIKVFFFWQWLVLVIVVRMRCTSRCGRVARDHWWMFLVLARESSISHKATWSKWVFAKNNIFFYVFVFYFCV